MRRILASLLFVPALVGTAYGQPTGSSSTAQETPAPASDSPTATPAPAPVYAPPEGAAPVQEAQPAQVQPVQAYYVPPAETAQPKPGAHLHDGFYLRLSLGFGAGRATQNYGTDELKYSGTAMMFDVLIGGSLIPGLVLGGGLISHSILSPKVDTGTTVAYAAGDVSLDMSTLGLFMAVYPDPSAGFNIHALVGYSSISLSNGNLRTDHNPGGLSLMGGAGYDFWISDQWSIGPDVRVAYATTSYSESDGTENKISMLVPTLSFTATYH